MEVGKSRCGMVLLDAFLTRCFAASQSNVPESKASPGCQDIAGRDYCKLGPIKLF